MEVACSMVNIRASIHPSSCAAIELSPEVTAAQMLVKSAPSSFANIPCLIDPEGLTSLDCDISETRRPYALNNAGVAGRIISNRAPSFLVVRCSSPSSASAFLFTEIEAPRPSYSFGGASFTKVKSKFKFARDRDFSLCS